MRLHCGCAFASELLEEPRDAVGAEASPYMAIVAACSWCVQTIRVKPWTAMELNVWKFPAPLIPKIFRTLLVFRERAINSLTLAFMLC